MAYKFYESDSDLVFNPKAYAEICAKKDRKAEGKKTGCHKKNYFSSYAMSDSNKIWNAINDYRASEEWG